MMTGMASKIVVSICSAGSEIDAMPRICSAAVGRRGSLRRRLMAIGDSIPYNDPFDCPGCTEFVDRMDDELPHGRTSP